MRKKAHLIYLSILLVMLSALIYALHYYLFGKDTHFVADWFFGSLAFLPISILFVTIIFETILNSREKKALLMKLNMVIGAFFSEVGNDFIRQLVNRSVISGQILPSLLVDGKWEKAEFASARQRLKAYDYGIDGRSLDLDGLRKFISAKKEFLLRLLENQNLLEHETFTDLLWALFHVIEEFEARESLDNLSQADLNHISGDIQRAYALIVTEWLSHMEHLKNNYPYLFSLAVRKNPFDRNARAEIE